MQRNQRHGLELDTTGPLLAESLEHRPGDGRLRPHGIEVRADRPRAVREAAAEPEVHAPADVLGGPVSGAVLGHRSDRGVERAVRVRGALPGVTLVEVRVDVDEARPHLAALEIDV